MINLFHSRSLHFAIAALTFALSASAVSGRSGGLSPDRTSIRDGYATAADGTRLYYRVVGKAGPVIVAPFAAILGTSLDPLARRFRVVTYDPRGRGRSDALKQSRLSHEDMILDIEAVRLAVGAEKIALIGWSVGGAETYAYALKKPQHVTRLVQMAPVPPRSRHYDPQIGELHKQNDDPAARQRLANDLRSGVFKGKPVEECRARTEVDLRALFVDRRKVEMVPDNCELLNERPASIDAFFRALGTSTRNDDWRPTLGQVHVPRLVIYGYRDMIPEEAAVEWVRGRHNARIMRVHGSGHFPMYEQPAQVLEAIALFLSGRWPRSSTRVR